MDFLQKLMVVTFVLACIFGVLTWVCEQVKRDPMLPMVPGLITLLCAGMCAAAFVMKLIHKVLS